MSDGASDEDTGRLADYDDHQLAEWLANRAGEHLLDLRVAMTAQGASADELRAAGDAGANRLLMDALERYRPHDPVLSEEEDENPVNIAKRLASHRTWIVDPLDGTREYGEPDRTDWAVHVALCVEGVATVGAVALPAIGRTFTTGRPVVLPPPSDRTRIIVSRTRRPAPALAVNDALGGTLVEMGSAGAKAMAVLRGEADIYPHAGGQYEWDSCAPVAVATASGLWCSRLDGSALRYNNADPSLPDLLICRPELAERAITAANFGT